MPTVADRRVQPGRRMTDQTHAEILGMIQQKLADIREDVAEVKIQTKLTNGRVTQLEARNIAAEAVREDRAARLKAEVAERQAAMEESEHERDRRMMQKAALISAGATLLVFVLAALLGLIHIHT